MSSFSYSSSNSGSNGFTAPGATEIITMSDDSHNATATGTFTSDTSGKGLFEFRRVSNQVHLSGMYIAKKCPAVDSCRNIYSTFHQSKCVEGYYPVGSERVYHCVDYLCHHKLGKWAIVNFEGGSIMGWGYGCNLRTQRNNGTDSILCVYRPDPTIEPTQGPSPSPSTNPTGLLS